MSSEHADSFVTWPCIQASFSVPDGNVDSYTGLVVLHRSLLDIFSCNVIDFAAKYLLHFCYLLSVFHWCT